MYTFFLTFTLARGMHYLSSSQQKGGISMLKKKETWLTALTAGVSTLIATPAFARGVSIKDAGVTLWIFIIIGAVIVLLQLIPAAILFFSFIGTSTNMVFRRKDPEEAASGEKSVLSNIGPAPVKK